jgi:hypothetical protein
MAQNKDDLLSALESEYEGAFQFRELLDGESDRGCGLAAAAYLDSELARLLRGYLVDDKKVLDGLFDASGALSSFSSRIDLAYLLGLIPPIAARDLHLIRKIRNEFAHIPGNLTFEYPSIASRCKELHHDIFKEDLPPRDKFMRVATGVAAFIHVAIITKPRCIPADNLDINSLEIGAFAQSAREAVNLVMQYLQNARQEPEETHEGSA